MKRTGAVIFCGLLILAASAIPASACAVCFGNADSNLTKGVGWGIISLLGIVVVVLGGITSFFVYLAKRASVAAPQLSVAQPMEETIKKA